jgi:two-component system sensor histidine kinase YesM
MIRKINPLSQPRETILTIFQTAIKIKTESDFVEKGGIYRMNVWEGLWENMSLVRRMTITMTCFLIIPTTLICILCFQAYKYYTQEEMVQALQTSLYTVDSRMEGSLEIAQAVSEELSSNAALVALLDTENTLTPSEEAENLKSVKENWIDIYHIYPQQFAQMKLYTARPSLIGQTGEAFAIRSLDNLPARLDRQTEDLQYLAPQTGLESGEAGENQMILQIWRLVYHPHTKEILGAVELDFRLQQLTENANRPDDRSDINELLMGTDGQLYYQTGDLQTEQFNTFGFTTVLFQTDGKVRNVYIHGDPCLVASHAFGDTGLMAAVLISKADLQRAAPTILGWIGLIAILGILGMMTLIHYSIGQLLERLMRLDDVIGQVNTGGDLTITVEEDEYNDEISRIKRRFNQMTAKLQELIRVTVAQEKAQKDAELRALQAQVNPHFLYNTLESMRMQCEIDQYYVIGDALEALGTLLHYTAKWQSNEATFRQEWKYLKNYIAVMSIRLASNFTWEMHWEPETGDVVVPKMLLQPLVENSFQHGFREVPPPWHLEVEAAVRDHHLWIHVWDNGNGMTEERLTEIRDCLEKRKAPRNADGTCAIGLVNLAQRIDRICQPGSKIEIANRAAGGVEITVTIPMTEGGKDHVSDLNCR